MTKYEDGVNILISVCQEIAEYESEPKGRNAMETDWLERIKSGLKKIDRYQGDVLILDKKSLDEWVRNVLIDIREKFFTAFDLEDDL